MNNATGPAVAVIGAGNSGQAIAGFLSLSGHTVKLWNRNAPEEVSKWLNPISSRGGLEVSGIVRGFAPIAQATTSIEDAISDTEVIIVNTTTDAFQDVGELLAPHISSSQRVLLMAAGTLGSLDLWKGLVAGGYTDELLVGETSTTVFGSRTTTPASIRIGGRKEGVKVATLPSGHGADFSELLPEFTFEAAGDVLSSGFDNVGSALHAVPMVLTAGWVEAHGGEFLYYVDGITPSIVSVMEEFDRERLAVAQAFGYESTPLSTYLIETVGGPVGTLYESIHNCPMYATTKSADKLDHRFLWEDTMAGVVPVLALSELANVPAPIHRSVATLAGSLLQRDLVGEGRTIGTLGLEGLTPESLRDLVTDGARLAQWKQQFQLVATTT